MKKYIFTFTALCLALFSSQHLSATIYSVNTLEEVSEYFEEANPATLAVFDLNTLIQPADPAFQVANIRKYKDVAKEVLKALTFDERMNFFTLISLKSAPVLIETYSRDLFEDLDDKGVKRIVVSRNLTSSFKEAGKLEDLPGQRLALVGIDFSSSFYSFNPIVFDNLVAYRQSYPLFKQGILSTNGMKVKKNEALIALLERVNFSPKTMIYVAQSKESLKQLEAALLAHNPKLEFVGLQYSGAYDYLTPYISEARFKKKWQELAKEAKKCH